jgi:hypothetical protein
MNKCEPKGQRSNQAQTTAFDLLDGMSDLLLKAPSMPLATERETLLAQFRAIEKDPKSITGE